LPALPSVTNVLDEYRKLFMTHTLGYTCFGMSPMDPVDAGLRSQDYHDGLRDVQTTGLIQVEMARTLVIGKAATLAIHLKGLLTIEQIDAFQYMAADLGITPLELDGVLKELEELEFIRVVRHGQRITRLETSIPEFKSSYSQLGRRWEDMSPRELERAAVDAVNSVARCPLSRHELDDRYRLPQEGLAVVLDIGSNAGLLASFEDESGETFYYSPLTVEEDPRPFVELAKRHPTDEVVKAFSTVRDRQGLSIHDARFSSDPVLLDAYNIGALLPVQVNAHGEQRGFLFIPRGDLAREEKVTMDKARAILACVRFGEGYAKGTRVRDPSAILRALLDRGRLRAHPDHPQQYGLLVTQGIGAVEAAGGGLYTFHFHDSPENRKAAELALQMLEVGEAPSAKIAPGIGQALARPLSYRGPAQTRGVIRRASKHSKTTNLFIVRKLSNLVRGVETG